MLKMIKVEAEGNSLNTARLLFKEYANELNEDLCFQSFDDELNHPLKKYGPPAGVLFLAEFHKEIAGCIALQPLKDNKVCEMKRLYVRPPFRRFGIAGKLVDVLMKEAKIMNYEKMVLDTLERLQPAIRLYAKFGFINTSAYYANPLPNVIYMEKML